MVFTILAVISGMIFIVLLGIAIASKEYNPGIPTAFLMLAFCAGLSCIILGICGAFNAGSAPYGEKFETSRIYVLAENTYVEQGNGRLEFIYLDDNKVPREFEEYLDKILIKGDKPGTVEVTTTRYEQGTWMFPWGMSDTERTAIIR